MEQLFSFSIILIKRIFMADYNTTDDKRKTILIVGINSFVGSNLAEFLKRDYRIVGTYYRKFLRIPGVLSLPCNVLNKEEVQLVMYAFKPDFVLYCAGLTSVKECNDSPNMSDALNSSGLFNISELAPRYGARVVYFSNQFVFSGENKKHNEMDNPDALTQYGKSQSSTEFYLQKSSLNYLIIRCCRLYGRGISPLRENWFEIFQRNFIKNKSTVCDNFSIQGFLDIYYLGLVVKMCIDKNVVNRLIHFSSQDTMSYFDFAKHYCEVYRQSEELVVSGKWNLPKMKGSVNKNKDDYYYYKLDILNLEGLLKIKMPTVRESLEFTYSRWNGTKHSAKNITSAGDGVSFI
jgi:dTDP-4-dehydrorhamnose reductase